MANDFIALDTGTPLLLQFLKASDGTAYDLSGCTVTLRYQIDGEAPIERTMNILSALSGTANYTWVAYELPKRCVLTLQATVTTGGGLTLTTLESVSARVGPRLGMVA